MQLKPQFDTLLVCHLYHQGRSPEYIAKHLRTTEALIEAIQQVAQNTRQGEHDGN